MKHVIAIVLTVVRTVRAPDQCDHSLVEWLRTVERVRSLGLAER